MWFELGHANLLVPAITQVFPFGIVRFDQADLLRPQPAFEFLLSADSSVDVRIAFEINQVADIIFGCESAEKMCLVLKDASFEFAGDTYVENATLAARDVYEV